MPIRKVKGGYKWGGRGKLYRGKGARKKAARQAAAAYAHGYRGLSLVLPCGISLGYDPDQPRDEHGQFSSAGMTKISAARGSNPGGTYEDPVTSQRWYVKRYSDPTQGAGEHIANAVYRRLGIGAPESRLGDKEYASKMLPGKTLGAAGLDKQLADKVLDGYAADVLLGNWDAVGTGHDNILVSPGGDSVTRVDQGGTLLHRAQGALKPEYLLDKVTDYESMADAKINPYYAKVLRVAGLKHPDELGQRFVKQVDAIDAARPSAGWKQLVDASAPGAPAKYRGRVTQMLEARHAGLLKKRDELMGKVLSLAEHDVSGELREEDGRWTDSGSGARVFESRDSRNASELEPDTETDKWGKEAYGAWVRGHGGTVSTRDDPDVEGDDTIEIVNEWAGNGYGAINEVARNGPKSSADKLFVEEADELAKVIDEAPRVPEDVVAWRGLTGPLDVKPGDVIGDAGFASTSLDRDIAAREFTTEEGTLLKIKVPKGTKAIYVDAVRDRGEEELLLQRKTQLKVVSVRTGVFRTLRGVQGEGGSAKLKRSANMRMIECEVVQQP